MNFSLDYLPSEPQPDGTEKRTVEIDGRPVEIWTDWQQSNTEKPEEPPPYYTT